MACAQHTGGNHGGEGKGAPALSKEGDSKTPLSLVFPPSGNQRSSDVVSGERGINSPS